MRRILYPVVALFCLASAARASAQDEEHRTSIGAGVAGIGMFQDSGLPKTSSGVVGWGSVNLARGFAMETRVSWFPTREAPFIESQGGRTLTVVAGPRAALISSRHVLVHGVLQPGIIRFSNTSRGRPDDTPTLGPGTHLMLDMGFGVELMPRSRWSPRVDFLHTLYVVPGALHGPPASSGNAVAILSTPGKIADTFQVSAGIGYRSGTRRTSSQTARTRRLVAGPQVAHSSVVGLLELAPNHDTGFGVFASWRVWRHVYADAAVSLFRKNRDVRSPWEGGRMLQGFAGVKAGSRVGRYGAFLKARAGMNSHSSAFFGSDLQAQTRTLGRSNLPALDLGGIIEADAGRRTVLRFEAGDVISFYGRRTVVRDGETLPQPSLPSRQSIQMSLGAGWRF